MHAARNKCQGSPQLQSIAELMITGGGGGNRFHLGHCAPSFSILQTAGTAGSRGFSKGKEGIGEVACLSVGMFT